MNEKEMCVRYVIAGRANNIDHPLYSAPITARDNFRMALLEKKAKFMPAYQHILNFTPRCVSDCEARGAIFDGADFTRHPEGFPDMFGIEWKFILAVGGAISDGGEPLLKDMNDWREKIIWPDVNSFAWEWQHEISDRYVSNVEQPIVFTIFNGYFERMISMMGFENAAMAIIDEDQEEAIHAFLDRLADLYIQIVDRVTGEFPQVTGITIHDDWGSQRAPFFSLHTVMEMLVPHMRRVADHIHGKGLFYDMHSCGQVEALVPAMIAAGVDCWCGQPMNDQAMLFQKYGDQLCIGINIPPIPADLPREKVEGIAREFADAYMQPGKVAMFGFNSQVSQGTFWEYLYRHSRRRAEELGF